MKILKNTRFPHSYDADGTRLTEPCDGHMQIAEYAGRVIAICSECGCGYQFQYVSARDHMSQEVASSKVGSRSALGRPHRE